ncbi:MAG: beta-ketoacyl-[acyl-carrier-protein] synthase family protein [Planctomycetia bacterium]|uniref:Ketosynthase family 3 (KS3) domain-containing protein n=1 Tax=Candidatus Brocadia sapporoensis TaxID=392547 RepID=A0A1V6M0D1_9BACT|nr:beta-ketoacyl-[acyl-carrier-protein] synthase family protein [Candidatus Brocadia sapporoensis]MCC7239829.1 beta-ketoacyl-[acyl-carrier-protein] synthase family protein [Candidatus Brocadia sp.]QOJ06474.1 MAG: beta-ketoacyl-[acyl-carrier-protein] synthase family protein [Planctomycetia bacterium]TVL95681.1 MAG: beta-ketoacyl-[acyl-carrier-protein] synthase family protein [Candidatus Brocadia sp. BL1]MDG6005610.1 beta-ketoacyl-[acyl-carrier-protein] synthase family protein [Candidatus Brocadi
MEKTRIVVTGVSVISPVGSNKEVFWKNLTNGVSGIKPVTLFDVSKFKSKLAGEISNFDAKSYLGQKGIRHIDRTSLLVSSATILAIKDANLENNTYGGDELGIVVGSTYGSIDSISSFDFQSLREGPNYVNPMDFPNTVLNAPASRASIFCKATGLNTTISNGITSSIDAIIYASDFLRMGRVKAVIAGGVHGLTHDIFWGAHNSQILSGSKGDGLEISAPFDKRRNGMIIGEASALVILETLEDALKRNASIYAEIKGYGTAFDPKMAISKDHQVDGNKRAMVNAIHDANLTLNDVSYISANAYSGIYGDAMETKVIKDVFGMRANLIPVSAIKSMTGECYDASGALQAIAAIMSISTNTVPPTINYEERDPDCDLDYVANTSRVLPVKNVLINTFSRLGNNSSLIISKYKP